MTTPAVLHVPELADEPGLVHGFSTVSLGSMGLTRSPDPDAVMASRRHFARILGVDAESLTVAGAVHGAVATRVDHQQDVVRGADALVTDRRGVALFATYADCFPIVLWDPEHRCAALVHAGWRGSAGRVGPAAIKAMHDEYGSLPARMKAGIGPGICGRCYEVGPEVATRFNPMFVRESAGDRLLLDLAAANRAQLEELGVEAVYDIGICTKEHYLFPSNRRHPDGTRFGTLVAIR